MMEQIEFAINLVEDGDVERGLEILSTIEKNADDQQLYQIAQHYYQWGFLEKARDILQQLLYVYPDEGELFVLLAEIMIDLDNEEEAIALLGQISEDDPVYIESLLLQADLFQMQGLVEVSEQKLLIAQQQSDNEPIIEFALAELYTSTGEYNKSISYYMNVLKEEVVVAGVNVNGRIAEALSATGKFEEALPYFEEAISKQEDSYTLFGFGFTAYQAKYYQKAIEVLSRLKELDPDYPSLYLYLALSYEEEAMFEDSLKALQAGIEVDSLNKELFFHAGKIAMQLGEKDLVEKYLRDAIGIDPGYIDALLHFTKFLLLDERYEEVVECLETVMEYGEFDEQFEWDLAYSKNKLEQYSDALNHYRRAYTFFKETPEFLKEYGYFLLEDGKREEAIEIFKEYLKIDPTNYEIEELVEETR